MLPKSIQNNPTEEDFIKLSTMMLNLCERLKSEKVSLGEIINNFEDQGFFILLALFSAPTAIPLPHPPGFSILTGIPILILSSQILLGRDRPSFPSKIMAYRFRSKLVSKVITKIIPYVQKVESFSKPRYLIFITLTAERILGFICLLGGLFISAPLPFSHSIPALGVLLISLGFLNRDGVVIVGGIIVSFIGIIISLFVGFLAIKSGKFLFS